MRFFLMDTHRRRLVVISLYLDSVSPTLSYVFHFDQQVLLIILLPASLF